MRRWALGAVGALIVIGGCDKKGGGDEVAPEDSGVPQEPSSTAPMAPTAMGATDFCKLIFEAPKRTLDKLCKDPDKKSPRYEAVRKITRERVQACWSMLSQGVQHKRMTLPVSSARRCATALEKLPWEKAFDAALGDISECRNIAIGLAGAGKPCRASFECGPGLFCSGGNADTDGVCMKKVAAGDSCQRAAFKILGESEASCDAGSFCDHGGGMASVVPTPRPASPWGLDESFAPSPRPTKGPRLKMGKTSVSGRLPPEVIQRIVRSNFGRFRVCYQTGLKTNPKLKGRVTVRFVITRTGSVSSVSGSGDIADKDVISCVTRAFYGLTFPQPEGGIVTVSYPIVFTPAGDTTVPGDEDRPPPPPSLGPPSNTCVAMRKSGEDCRASRECGAQLACVMGKCGKELSEGAECRVGADCDEGLRCLVDAAKATDEPADGDGEGAAPPPVLRKCSKPRVVDAACESDSDCAGACASGKCAAFCGSE